MQFYTLSVPNINIVNVLVLFLMCTNLVFINHQTVTILSHFFMPLFTLTITAKKATKAKGYTFLIPLVKYCQSCGMLQPERTPCCNITFSCFEIPAHGTCGIIVASQSFYLHCIWHLIKRIYHIHT